MYRGEREGKSSPTSSCSERGRLGGTCPRRRRRRAQELATRPVGAAGSEAREKREKSSRRLKNSIDAKSGRLEAKEKRVHDLSIPEKNKPSIAWTPGRLPRWRVGEVITRAFSQPPGRGDDMTLAERKEISADNTGGLNAR